MVTSRPSSGDGLEAAPVLLDVGGAEHVALDPRCERVAVAADLVPGNVEGVVAVVVAVRVGRVRPTRRGGDRVDRPRRQDNRARPRLELAHDLLDGDDRAGGGEHDLLLDACDPPELDVAGPVCTLRVDYPDVRPVRADG